MHDDGRKIVTRIEITYSDGSATWLEGEDARKHCADLNHGLSLAGAQGHPTARDLEWKKGRRCEFCLVVHEAGIRTCEAAFCQVCGSEAGTCEQETHGDLVLACGACACKACEEARR